MNQVIIVSKDGNEKITDRIPEGLKIEWLGNNAFFKIHEPFMLHNNVFQIGDNSFIEVGKNANINNLFIRCASKNSFVKVGENFVCHKSSFILARGGANQSINIGDHCLFAVNVDIYTSDGHTIYDSKSLKILNKKGGNIEIGNHCWIGHSCMITKKGSIANDTIVGAMSLVNKKFDKSNVVIAGSPAKIIKKNVNWDTRHPDECNIGEKV